MFLIQSIFDWFNWQWSLVSGCEHIQNPKFSYLVFDSTSFLVSEPKFLKKTVHHLSPDSHLQALNSCHCHHHSYNAFVASTSSLSSHHRRYLYLMPSSLHQVLIIIAEITPPCRRRLPRPHSSDLLHPSPSSLCPQRNLLSPSYLVSYHCIHHRWIFSSDSSDLLLFI